MPYNAPKSQEYVELLTPYDVSRTVISVSTERSFIYIAPLESNFVIPINNPIITTGAKIRIIKEKGLILNPFPVFLIFILYAIKPTIMPSIVITAAYGLNKKDKYKLNTNSTRYFTDLCFKNKKDKNIDKYIKRVM